MYNSRIYLTLVGLLLVCGILLNLTGCAVKATATDLMEGITPNEVVGKDDLSPYNVAVSDFAIRLFKASEEVGKNTLVSPLSVLCALAMTANGATGETLQQMERVFGMTAEELNVYLNSYLKRLPQSDKGKLNLANSVWFTNDEGFTVNRSFLQANADYYGADVYKAPMDEQTRKDINNWVKTKTDGMIPELLNSLSDETVMCLINALAFEADWFVPYEKHQVQDGQFTKEDGTQQNGEFMYCTENAYLQDEKASGFIKYYHGKKYAFVAMLPNDGVSVSEYISSLDGASLNALLSSPVYETVYTSIPKFKTEYDADMNDALTDMGMPKAFDGAAAEFSGIGTHTKGNIHISRVVHKAFISVGEQGTKAGAATAVIMDCGGMAPQQPKEVYLDKPFVYMLIDCENNIPFFIGTMTDIEN